MMLVFHAIIDREYNVRSSGDHRKLVDRVLVEYRDEAGDTYRKSFERAHGAFPMIPQRGTSAALNAQKYQW